MGGRRGDKVEGRAADVVVLGRAGNNSFGMAIHAVEFVLPKMEL